MEDLLKLTQIGILYGFYQSLLTEKQNTYFSMYYEKDYSLKEISDYYSISRNAIYDQIKIVVIKLIELEEKLKLAEKASKRRDYLNKFKETKDEIWLDKIQGLDE